jgi:peptide/nickel transport system permease protein
VPDARRIPGAALWGGSILLLLALLAVAGPGLVGGDPSWQDLARRLEPPSADHWMGTDALGRDVAVRLVHGARVSLSVGGLATAFALLIGFPLGALAGYRGGLVDAAVSRVVEAALCVPTLLLALAVVAASPAWLRSLEDVPKLALVLGATGWGPVARYARGEFFRLRCSEMVLAERAVGASIPRVIFRSLLPSALAPVLVASAFAVGAAIGFEAALSFLGLGVSPPAPTWGGLLFEAREQVHRAWWLTLFPGLALLATVVGCSLLGEGLREALDPRREGQRT